MTSETEAHRIPFPRSGAPARNETVGFVWQRRDFRESSRLITFVTPDRGRLTTLGKGAHRPGSQCLGRIDFLNLVKIKFSRGTLPILHRVRLQHEPRRLREPRRFTAASYIVELFDPAFLPGRPDSGMFELLSGGLRLLERAPTTAIPSILLGLELRYLRELGLQPRLDACQHCGTPLQETAFVTRQHPGITCGNHPGERGAQIPAETLAWLQHIAASPGKTWPRIPTPPPAAAKVMARWLRQSLERWPQSRAAALGQV